MEITDSVNQVRPNIKPFRPSYLCSIMSIVRHAMVMGLHASGYVRLERDCLDPHRIGRGDQVINFRL